MRDICHAPCFWVRSLRICLFLNWRPRSTRLLTIAMPRPVPSILLMVVFRTRSKGIKIRLVLVAGSGEERNGQLSAYLNEEGMKPVCVQAGLEAVTYLTEAQYEGHSPISIRSA